MLRSINFSIVSVSGSNNKIYLFVLSIIYNLLLISTELSDEEDFGKVMDKISQVLVMVLYLIILLRLSIYVSLYDCPPNTYILELCEIHTAL